MGWQKQPAQVRSQYKLTSVLGWAEPHVGVGETCIMAVALQSSHPGLSQNVLKRFVCEQCELRACNGGEVLLKFRRTKSWVAVLFYHLVWRLRITKGAKVRTFVLE